MSFIYGRPVRQGEFLGREPELLTIFDRLRNGESTAIVGEPHIGKTSLLLQIVDSKNQEHFLGDDSKRLVISFKDLQPISIEYMPAHFWGEALEPFLNKSGHATIATRLNNVKDENYSNAALRKLFQNINDRGQVLVLLLAFD